MPVYTYRREDGTTFDVRQKFTDEPLNRDPETGQPVTRVIHAAGIVFKGSGFYVNDSKGAKSNLSTSTTKTDDTATTTTKSENGTPKTEAPAKTESSKSSSSSDAAD